MHLDFTHYFKPFAFPFQDSDLSVALEQSLLNCCGGLVLVYLDLALTFLQYSCDSSKNEIHAFAFAFSDECFILSDGCSDSQSATTLLSLLHTFMGGFWAHSSLILSVFLLSRPQFVS